jgi:hypothetical protein
VRPTHLFKGGLKATLPCSFVLRGHNLAAAQQTLFIKQEPFVALFVYLELKQRVLDSWGGAFRSRRP